MAQKKIILTPKDFFINEINLEDTKKVTVKHIPSGSYAASSNFTDAMEEVLDQLYMYYKQRYQVIYRDGNGSVLD